MRRTIRKVLGLGLLGMMLATPIVMAQRQVGGKKGAKKGSSKGGKAGKGAPTKGGRGGN
jgi:hypothetical protein